MYAAGKNEGERGLADGESAIYILAFMSSNSSTLISCCVLLNILFITLQFPFDVCVPRLRFCIGIERMCAHTYNTEMGLTHSGKKM